MAHAHILQVPRFTDDQALAWLAARSPVQIGCVALARQFRWHRNTVGNKLRSWADTGKIARDGRTIIVQKKGDRVVGSGGQMGGTSSKWATNALAGLLFVIALCMAGVLLAVNGVSWYGFAKNALAAYAFVVLGLAIAVAVMALPTAARLADASTARMLWCIWLFVFVVDVLTNIGFAYGNFGSAVAGTEASVGRRAFLERRIHSLISERQKMPAFVPTAQKAVDDAKAAVARECIKVGPECRKREGELTEANRALGLTDRSGKIADELREAEGELQGIPITASADPLTDGVIDLVYQTSGHKLEVRAVNTGRNVVFALFLLVPAGFFRGAASLARR